MSKKKNTKKIAILLLASITISYLMSTAKKEPEKNISSAKPPIVSALYLKKEDVQIPVVSQGMVLPLTETMLSAEISGEIIEISPKFVAGGIFKKGETLIKIDPKIYEVAYKQAKALKDQRQNEYEDSVKIRKQGYLSESEYLAAVSSLAAAEAQLVKAENDLDNTNIRLPYDGMVREKSADLGQYVNIGNKLGVTFSTEFAEVRLPLSDRDAPFAGLPSSNSLTDPSVEKSTSVNFRIDLNPSKTRSGYIERSEGVVDEKTRMIFAVARLEDPYNLKNDEDTLALPMGAFVSAEILSNESYNFVRIPRSAIINNRQVILIDSENKIQYKDIDLVRTDESFGYIKDDFFDGQRISLTPIEDGVNGMIVRVE
tara:strand:+ start:1184 stop:2296 length:1113 start_codon:yes stop_codon:yes gene_type:complete